MLSSRNASVRAFRRLQFSDDTRELRSVQSVAGITDVNSARGGLSTRARWRLKASVPRTHIVTFPMYQNAEAWARLSEFRKKLWECGPEMNLERNIIIPWINEALEFKLGNIVIKDKSPKSVNSDANLSFPSFEQHQVMDVLQSLKNPIRELLYRHGHDAHVLRVPLGRVRPLSNDSKHHPTRMHVLLLEPCESKEAETLRAVSRLVFDTFKNAGMLIAPPAVAPPLATTLINTKNRALHRNLPAAQRPKSQKRQPINLEALYASESFRAFLRGTPDAQPPSDLQQPVSLNLGAADFTCVCIRRVAMPVETRDLSHDGKIDFAE